MKDNVKLRTSWSLASIASRLFQVPRAGIKQGFWQFLFAIVAAVFTVLVIWGPTLSAPADVSTQHQQQQQQPAGPIVHRTSNALANEKSPVHSSSTKSSDDDDDGVLGVEKKLKLDEASDEELRLVALHKKQKARSEAATKPLVNLRDKRWNTASFAFEPVHADWDKQRAAAARNRPNLRAPVGRKSRVMLVTGTGPTPCSRSVGNYIYIKAAKNKVDYCRLHDIQLFYNMASPDPNFDGWWTKIPLLRSLMVSHPEVDWFWWMDSDAWITDMTFEVPFDKYAAAGKNLFLYGDESKMYGEKSWIGINTGDMAIRNCQWSLDLLDAWASLGVASAREASGKFLTEVLTERPANFPADDQSSLAYLLVFEKRRWAAQTALEMSFTMSGHWPTLTGKFEELRASSHPGFGDHRWPLCVHFAGCQPCSDIAGYGKYPWEACQLQMDRTFAFADDQVLRTLGFQVDGGLETSEVKPLHEELQEALAPGVPYHIYPNVSDWDLQRRAFLKRSKDPRDRKGAKPRVLLVSGSGPRECHEVRGTHFLLKALKNKIDYARMHDMDFFYNMANLDKQLTGWWGKIPVIRTMMLAHPEAEWIWWVDSDAVFTDMVFEPPLQSYPDYNLIMWGSEEMVFEKKSFIGLNAGDMIVRNCQWSLDFFDAIIPFGPEGAVREEAGRMLTKVLTDRPDMQADDQSAIIHLLNTQKAKYASKVNFENGYTLSGSWDSITFNFEKLMEEHHPGFGDWRWPLVTHFAGCQPCSHPNMCNYNRTDCFEQMDRSLHFADNQVIHAYGLEHRTLGTWELQKLGTAAAAAKAAKLSDAAGNAPPTTESFKQKFH
ncbi:xyloglucan 6-xylosyltransferase [Marchantia polymorpha subsp. ruderalis]|nr:hypothetical protein MARPO_0024s0013 [Marchantia polymorpha]BBN06577.1 hypothetical protein Mp_3g22350 [Marchantia polymorpha subsp. ruderalis]|eukprot:PTQ43477.1 hypothetical protein MARPO_0024s0013 [Marchantia polymorpha]